MTTVYELLGNRFDARAMRAAGGMYLIGRVFASGARLYLAAIAVSMIVFADIAPSNVLIASVVLVVFGLVFTFVGGLRSVIWSDLVQVVLYVGAALAVLYFLWTSIPAPAGDIVRGLMTTPEGANKLRLIDLSLDLTQPFSLLASVTGITLLFFASMGLDQDITQRFLACRDSREGSRALYASVLAQIPVVLLFLAIGSLLYVFYDRPDLMGGGRRRAAAGEFRGEKITIFMHYILTQIPPGVRGFVAVGVLAAAAVNSGLISMASVLIQDFYRPWIERRRRDARGAFRPRRPGRHGPARARLARHGDPLLLLAAIYAGASARFRLVGDDLRLFRPARRLFHRLVHPARLVRLGDLRARHRLSRDRAPAKLCRRPARPARFVEIAGLPLPALPRHRGRLRHLPARQPKSENGTLIRSLMRIYDAHVLWRD